MFALPFVIGFCAFFLYPLVQSVVFSLNDMEILPSGYALSFTGLANYRDALFRHDTYVRTFTETISAMLINVPLILMFSFFIATLLNQEFKGRLIARVVFFLPVILSSGVVLTWERTDFMMVALQSAEGEGTLMNNPEILSFLYDLALPMELVDYIVAALNRLPDIIRSSGVQILIFLAGLQSIPSALYEASSIEGATSWESFWKITFPMMSPLILTNVVYTVVYTLTTADNPLIGMIRDTAFGGMGFGVSSAMSWMYFLSIFVILAIAVGVLSRWVFYQE